MPEIDSKQDVQAGDEDHAEGDDHPVIEGKAQKDAGGKVVEGKDVEDEDSEGFNDQEHAATNDDSPNSNVDTHEMETRSVDSNKQLDSQDGSLHEQKSWEEEGQGENSTLEEDGKVEEEARESEAENADDSDRQNDHDHGDEKEEGQEKEEEEEEDEEEKREESERRETADAEVKEGNEENDEQTEGVEKTEVEELRDETAPPDAQATTDSGEEEVKADEGVHDKGGDEKDVKSGNEETETDTETATVTATTEEAEVDHDHENQKDVQEIKQTTPEQGAAETNQASAKIPQKARSSWGGSLFGWRSKEPKGDTQDKSKATARLSMSMTTKPDSHMTSEVCKLLLKDLETLETNTPRSQYRYRELLKSAERIIRDIDEEHHDQDSLTKSIRSSDAILKIALQASESKTANLSRMGLSMLQRLAACDGIDPDEFVKASNVFRLAVDSTDEAFQLRIVQLCSTSLQSPRICFHEKAMLLCIETLLSLHGSRYTHAAQIANLSIKSSLEGFFDLLSKLYEGECREAIIVMQELAKKSTEAEPADLESHVTMIGSHLFREFSSIIKLETSKKLQFRPHFSVCPMILGILDDILRAESKIFHKSKSFLNILNDQICSVLVYQLQRVAEAGTRAFVMKDSKQAVSAQDINIAIVRLLRCCSAVISYYSAPNSDDDCNDDCESNLLSCVANMISLFVHMAQEAKPSWLKLAALECLHEYTTSDELPTRLKKIHIVSSELNQSSDAENVIDMEMDAFAAIVSNYLDPPHPKETKNTRSSKQMVAAQRELPVKNFLSITEDEKMSWKRIIDTVSGEEPVLPPDWDTIAFELAIICSSNLSCAMNEMCNLQRPISTSSLSSFEDYPSYTVTDTKPDEESASSKVCNHMIDSWTISLMGLTRLCMQHIENDRLLQLVLRSLCSYMQASNELRQFHSRDLALSIICKAVGAPAPDSTTQLPARPRLLILDSIIRMVFDLGEDMQHSWKILFPVLQYWTANIANFGLQTKLSVYMKDKTSEASTSLGFAQEDVKFLKHVSRGIDKIFEDSDKLSRDACMSLLKTLEQAAVPTEKEEAQDGSVEDAADKNNLNSVYFGMSCAFVVAESNHARLEEIWDSLQTTIVKLCIHEESQIRKAAISIFERFVDSFLEKRDLAKASDDKLEKSMLGSLAEIFNQSPKEVKMEILRCIFEILKKRGKSIKSSWSILMQTFTNISKSNDVALVKEGIKCVSLVSSEFLSELDEKEFSSFLHLAIAFGRQTLDLETSLAAITSLRDCAEFVTAKLIAEEEEQEEEKESTRIEKVQLWLSIVDALLKLGSDKRENVRNESVKVLLDMLLEDERVKQQFHDKMGIVIQSFIFPYMEQIEQTTFEAVAEGSKSTQQWLSTWLTVFDGACKLIQLLFTLHLEHQGTLPDDVDETWKTFISRLVFAFECRSELIIRSAVCSISIMVKSMSKTFPRSMWDSLWECFESQVKKSCAKKLHKTGVVWEITDEMFDLVDDAITLSPQLVGHETIARLIHILGVIVSQEKAEEKEVVSHYKRMAKLLGGREVIEQVTLWHELVSSLLCLLPGDERSYEWTVNLNYTFAQRPARSKEEISAASQLLAELFCDEAAVVVQTNLFERIVVTFLVCVCSRSSSQAAVPWNDIVTSLERVLKAGMPIIQTASGISEEDKSQVWHNIVDGFSTVLTTPAAHAKDAQTFELDEVDGMMMRIVSSILAPLASRIDMHVDVLRIFDAILEDSCKQAALELPLRVKRSALSRRALQELMTLASWSPAAGVQADKVDFAAKIVIERIRTVLEMHANLGSSVPEPPDKSWLELAISSIKSLESLRLSPSCFDLLVEELEPPRSYAMDELPARTEEEEKALRKRSSRLHDRSSQTGHLLLLYSTLCKCILSSNREIRAMAKTLLEKVGEEIGLHAPM